MFKTPNFIFLIADDHRSRSLGVHGCAEVTTPHLDALARRGVDFTQAHCQNGFNVAVCVPSRASLMTGRNVFSIDRDFTDGRHAGGTIADEFDTFPQLLRRNGYSTHAVGKWHNDKTSFNRSFSSGNDIFFGGMSDHDMVPLHDYDASGAYTEADLRFDSRHSTDIFRSGAEQFLDQAQTDEPFFLYVAFTAPHDPRTPPEAFKVDPANIPVPPHYAGVHPFDNGEMSVRDEFLEAFPRSPASVQQHLADYYGMIAHLDDAIGRIVAKAEARGLLDNTVIVYTADHGLALGAHGLMGKQNLYEHSTNIPLLMAGPGMPQGVRNDMLVWHGDTRATVLALARLGDAPTHDGVNLLPFLRGETTGKPRETFGSAYRLSQRAIRDERYKLIRYYQDAKGSCGSDVCQLFDLQVDPDELNNLWFSTGLAEPRSRLEHALQTWQTAMEDPLLR